MPGHYKIIYHGRPRLKPTVRVKADLKKRLRYSLQHKGYRSRFKCTLQSYAYGKTPFEENRPLIIWPIHPKESLPNLKKS